MDFGLVPNAVIPSEMESLVMYKENFVLIAPANFDLNKKSFKSIKDFKDENWILPPKGEGQGYVELLDRIFQQHDFLPRVVYESPNSSSVLRLVSAGLDLTIIGKSALNDLSLNIKSIELENLPEKVEMRLVWLKERNKELFKYVSLFKSFIDDYKELTNSL